jgi:tetratricopeptide (TPR) repeat protein
MSLAFLLLVATASPARPDAAAGREAYEKGDYKRAMAEWQSAADRTDPDAEFGLGSLYEVGAGDLKQNYKQADYWYRKAADQGHVEAQYRLALIWAVGGDDFAADLAEAYKWVGLAIENKGVWSTLAADLKSQLDKVTSAGQRADAERRVNAWKEAHSAKKREEPPSTAAKAPSTGCPGWPFPTLPCTEQFPALPGTQGPPRAPTPQRPTAKAPIEELNEELAQIDCASLRSQISAQGSASISGTVPDAGQKTKLIQLAERLFPNSRPEVTIDIVPPPVCRSVAELQLMRVAGLIGEGGLRLRLNNGSSQLRQGDPMRLEVQGPAYAINLRIDYFSLDGQVAHLKPEGGEPAPKLAAGTTHMFGNPANGEVWNAGGAPFGTELITVIATPVPLDLGASRPKIEPASGYLRDLNRALGRISVPSGQPNVLATLLVRTSP